MTMPTSGTISLSQTDVELGLPSTQYIGLGDANVRSLFGVSSGIIWLSNGYGKSHIVAFVFNPTISSHTFNYNLKASAIAAGWDQTSPLSTSVTINAGIVVGSAILSNGYYGFDTGAGFPSGSTITLINNGYIIGAGGFGGQAGDGHSAGPGNGAAGSDALLAQHAISITNNGVIAGGGGGGGGGDGATASDSVGGSGGGGAGDLVGDGGAPQMSADGTVTGNGGMPGALTVGRGGGGGQFGGYDGGAGGNLGVAGVSAWIGGVGGAAGAAVTGNAYISWQVTGTRLGPIL